ncbi:MAG: DUF5069 domain-containing protein [Candidatus Latescibacteria bacterium]|nr:DUF5069 domain-containing protein [Candidatus Latescibacterota bacterium]
MNRDNIGRWAKDLRQESPRSPREMLGGYVILARSIDKCRAALLEINGEYNFWPCSLSSNLFPFVGMEHGQLQEFVATGASDDEVAAWFQDKSQIKDPLEIVRWNNQMRDMRLSDMPVEAQEYIENYAQQYLPKHRPMYVWFDMFDLEEGRL